MSSISSVSASIVAENTFTDWLAARPSDLVSVSIGGSFSGTVTLQRKFTGESLGRDIPNASGSVGFTAPTELTYQADEFCYVRIGIKTGQYSSGTADLRLGRG